SMRALERQLAALRGRCGSSHVAGECGILHELVAAAHGEACACHSDTPLGSTGTVASDKSFSRRRKA
ncbi:MAG: MerR family transcriptional regulator, partial [Candidatus Gallionella acididurans]